MAEGIKDRPFESVIPKNETNGSEYDLNEISDNGFFIYNRYSLNKPTDAGGVVINMSAVWGSQRAQIVHPNNDDGLYYRRCISGTWNEWKRLDA